VTVLRPDGSSCSLPAAWTDLVPPDLTITLGAGRARFRFEDLVKLADLIASRESE
jgi:hypothetical protein